MCNLRTIFRWHICQRTNILRSKEYSQRNQTHHADLLKVQRSCSLERCRLVRHRARAQPAAPNYHLPSPELQVVVSKVRLLGSASVSDKKSCPFSRLSEDDDSVMRLIPDEVPCLPRRRVAPRARHQPHQYRYLDPCTQPGPFPPELFIILTHRRGRLCLPVTCDSSQRIDRRKNDE